MQITEDNPVHVVAGRYNEETKVCQYANTFCVIEDMIDALCDLRKHDWIDVWHNGVKIGGTYPTMYTEHPTTTITMPAPPMKDTPVTPTDKPTAYDWRNGQWKVRGSGEHVRSPVEIRKYRHYGFTANSLEEAKQLHIFLSDMAIRWHEYKKSTGHAPTRNDGVFRFELWDQKTKWKAEVDQAIRARSVGVHL